MMDNALDFPRQDYGAVSDEKWAKATNPTADANELERHGGAAGSQPGAAGAMHYWQTGLLSYGFLAVL